MKLTTVLSMLGAGAVTLGGALLFVSLDVRAAAYRLEHPPVVDEPKVAVADDAEVAYCTPQFKKVLERVLHACGLAGQDGRRGCQPTDVKSFASIDDDDFNALFEPLSERGAIVMFDDGGDKLDEGAKKLIEERWEERRGARYFFIVARASKSGTVDLNRALSHRRANSVKFHVGEVSGDKDLDKKVGMLWLGNEFAQLKKDYCKKWTLSRKPELCNDEAINRSAFISWVDCRL